MNKDQIDRSTLQSIANLDQGDHAKILYRFLTKGGREGRIGRYVYDLPTQERKNFNYIALMEAIKNNPNFSDTLSAQEASEFMQPDKSLLDAILEMYNSYMNK